MNPEGKDREGWVMGGLQNAQENGYCRDFKVHSMGRVENMTERLQRLQPYVARSESFNILFGHSVVWRLLF